MFGFIGWGSDVPSPQTEDGYTRIANELLEAILRAPFSKRELLVVFAVIRKTYGYNKKADDMSLQQIALITGIPRPHISVTLRDLSTKKVLLIQSGVFGQMIGLNKKYNEWHVLPIQEQVLPNQNSMGGVTDSGTEVLPNRYKRCYQNSNHNRQLQKTTPKDKSEKKTGVTDSVTPKHTDADLEIANRILADILKINPKHKAPNIEKWATEIRLMRERDGRTYDEIGALWAWAHADSFWMTNILGPAKLREKWDMLTIKANQKGNHHAESGGHRNLSAVERVRRANPLPCDDQRERIIDGERVE